MKKEPRVLNSILLCIKKEEVLYKTKINLFKANVQTEHRSGLWLYYGMSIL